MKKDEYDIIIIGAGIGGLTAGNILAKNGLKVLILEKNHVPGGAATTFYKEGYPVDICHALCAVSDNGFIRKYLEYLDIYRKISFIELDKAFIYLAKDKDEPVFCYSDKNKFADELIRHFPDEATKIMNLFTDIEKIWREEVLKSYYNPSPLNLLCQYPGRYPNLLKYRNYTFERFLNNFLISPGLKEILSAGWPYLGLDRNEISALFMICLIGGYCFDKTFLIKGGFGKLTEALADSFKEKRGTLLYNKKVIKILISNKRTAYGVEDDSGNQYMGNRIVSNVDSKKTYLELIPSSILSNFVKRKITKLRMSCSTVQVHMVANANVPRDFLSAGSIIYNSHMDLEKDLRSLLKVHDAYACLNPISIISIHNTNNFIEKHLNDKYIFNLCWFSANHGLWDRFIHSYGRSDYEEFKKKIADDVTEELSKQWKVNKIEMKNVLTPISFEKWLNASDGAVYDLASYPNQSLLRRMQYKSKIKNLFMVGAKTFPGHGISGALVSAFSVSDILLKFKLTRKRFVLK